MCRDYEVAHRSRQNLLRAEALGKGGDFIGADKELEAALQFWPDNEEAKQLLADFKQHEPEQIERLRMERLERPKKVFDEVIREIGDSALFESHELTTSKPVREVQSAFVTQSKTAQPPFQDIHYLQPAPETFSFEAGQVFSGGTRQFVIVGGQSKDDETKIFFKVVEFKKAPFYDQPLLGSGSANYVLVNPNQAQSNEKVKAQITDGVRIVTECIQRAIGGTLNNK